MYRSWIVEMMLKFVYYQVGKTVPLDVEIVMNNTMIFGKLDISILYKIFVCCLFALVVNVFKCHYNIFAYFTTYTYIHTQEELITFC